MFFSREDLQTYIDWVFEDNPAGAEEIVVEVVSLEWLLAAMAASEESCRNPHASFTGMRQYTPDPCCAMGVYQEISALWPLM
jgi:hypothetical protein